MFSDSNDLKRYRFGLPSGDDVSCKVAFNESQWRFLKRLEFIQPNRRRKWSKERPPSCCSVKVMIFVHHLIMALLSKS
ncbi:hypothetical protein ElyMa_004515400 [Elysia marginata]|uniref:Uncharacterized protein n=1 Tax=Elysia marginata TaxID=1093978 RepID=A0AAV4HP33_9GAST|nr:hypothetical protein ElyMa_004515400 [Elysia marginata]